MGMVFRWLVLAMVWCTLASFAGGCSTPDGDDMDRLTRAVSGLSGEAAKAARASMTRGKIDRWLATKPQNDRIGRIECGTGGDGPEFDITVDGFRKWLQATNKDVENYQGALDLFFWDLMEHKMAELGDLCSSTYDFRYDPEEGHVPEDVLHPDTSARGIAEWLIASPVPPHGFAWGGALAELLPILCTLAVPWGCPDNPNYPGPTSPGNVPPPNGDAP